MKASSLLVSAVLYSGISAAGSVCAPAFGDFPAHEELSEERAAVDLSSHRLARTYRTMLRRAAAEDPTFAGHYVVAGWGCGNECFHSLIVDLNTGKVYGMKGKSDFLETSRGIHTRLDSRLLIADPPCDDGESCLSQGRSDIPVRYYVLEEGGLRFIQEIPCRVVKGKDCTWEAEDAAQPGAPADAPALRAGVPSAAARPRRR